TIGEGGVRPRATLLKGADTTHVRATSKSVARTIAQFMRAVVVGGTGGGAALPGVKVAGKTGTAELRTTVTPTPTPTPLGGVTPAAPDAAGGRRRGPHAGPAPRSRRHRRLVHVVRAARAPARGGLRAAGRPGRGRRHRRAGGQDRPPGRAEPLEVERNERL